MLHFKQSSLLFSKQSLKHSKHLTKLKTFSKDQTCLYTFLQTRIITKIAKTMASFQKNFQNHTKHHFKQFKNQSKWSKQVTKSPWKTLDEKGASTFPFHNLPPEPKKTSQRYFLCFLTFPLDKIKSRWRLLLNRNICEHKRKT